MRGRSDRAKGPLGEPDMPHITLGRLIQGCQRQTLDNLSYIPVDKKLQTRRVWMSESVRADKVSQLWAQGSNPRQVRATISVEK
jgi:hypothetical protein